MPETFEEKLNRAREILESSTLDQNEVEDLYATFASMDESTLENTIEIIEDDPSLARFMSDNVERKQEFAAGGGGRDEWEDIMRDEEEYVREVYQP